MMNDRKSRHQSDYDTAAYGRAPGLPFVDVDPARAGVPVTQSMTAGGKIAFDATASVVKLALSGAADAICAGQSSKDALDSARLRAHRNVRVGRITRHIAQEDVPKHVKPQFSRVVALTDGALHILGLERPKIAIAALNPHAGEDGLFGRQDIDVVEPAIRALREEGFDVEGPVGDMVFVKLRARQFDAVVAMYHDQGHIPVKLLGSSVDEKTWRMEALSGVNVTLGLPIIRTSVDHGTAFDIAGKGIASETSLIEAIELAVTMSRA